MVQRLWNGNLPAIGVPVFFLTGELIYAKARYGTCRGVTSVRRFTSFLLAAASLRI